MRFLLDTHYFIWLAREPSRVSDRVLTQLTDAKDIFVSPVSFQEISIKHKKRPERFEFTVVQAGQTVRDLCCQELPYRLEHAKQVDCLPDYHGDPFDRVLIAQAIVEGLTLLSADPLVIRYAGERQTPEGITRSLSVSS